MRKPPKKWVDSPLHGAFENVGAYDRKSMELMGKMGANGDSTSASVLEIERLEKKMAQLNLKTELRGGVVLFLDDLEAEHFHGKGLLTPGRQVTWRFNH